MVESAQPIENQEDILQIVEEIKGTGINHYDGHWP